MESHRLRGLDADPGDLVSPVKEIGELERVEKNNVVFPRSNSPIVAPPPGKPAGAANVIRVTRHSPLASGDEYGTDTPGELRGEYPVLADRSPID